MYKTNKTVIRKNNKAGKFTTIHHSVLHDKRLSSNAYRILSSILSDKDEFKLTYKLMENRFGLSENTVRVAFKLLIKCGYMRIDPNKTGRGNYYTISELGNLNTENTEEQTNEEVISDEEQKRRIKEKNDKNTKLYIEYVESIKDFLELENIKEKMKILIKNHIKGGILDFYPIRDNLNKAIKKEQKTIYDMCMKVTEKRGKNIAKKAVKVYSDWLKEQIYELKTLHFDFEKKWKYTKVKHQVFKTDFETAQADKREQDRADMY